MSQVTTQPIKLYFCWNNTANTSFGYTTGPRLLSTLANEGYNTNFRGLEGLPERIVDNFTSDIEESDCLLVFSDELDWITGFMIATAIQKKVPIIYMTTPERCPPAAIRGLSYDRIKFVYDVTEESFLTQLQYKHQWIQSFHSNLTEEGPFNLDQNHPGTIIVI
jgi:hypothetical protein